MKRVYFALAALAAIFAGCSKEVDTPEPVVPTEKTVTLKASIGDPETRVSSDNAGIFKWQSSDEITVVTNSNETRLFTIGQITDGTSAEFSGTIPTSDEIRYALYPASQNHKATGTQNKQITFHLDETVVWKADASNMPMLATVGDETSFDAVGGVLKLILFNIPADADYLKFSATNKKITGDFEIGNNVITTEAKSNSVNDNELVIDFSANYSANKVFYIPLPTAPENNEIDGFTVALYKKLTDTEPLFTVTSPKSLTVVANHLIIAKALNCVPAPADDSLTNDDITSSTLTGSYSTVQITSSTNKTWNVNALKSNSRIQLKKDDSSSYIQLPSYSDYISSVVLNGVYNGSNQAFRGTVKIVTARTGGDEIASVSPSGINAGDNVSLNFPKGYKTGYILCTDYALQITSITVKFRDIDAPVITAGAEELVIPVGSLTATTSVSLADAIDGLGLSGVVVYPEGDDDPNKWVESVSINEGMLTVTAKAANKTAEDYEATIKVKASGATMSIPVTQTSCMVPNPTVLTAITNDKTATITWEKDAHAESYVAYLHTDQTTTPATGGDEFTIDDNSVSEGICTLELTGLTYDQTYYLYVKVKDTDDDYVAPSSFASVSFTPEEAKGTAANPYRASELYDIVATYASGQGPTNPVYVKGYVSKANNPSSNSQRYWISDDGTSSTNEFQAYNGKGIGGVNITESNRVNIGDWVVVLGTAINFSGTTPEFNAGSTIITHNPKLAAPTFNPEADTYYSAQSVDISATNSATIYYTTDGTEPTTSSTVYNGPIVVDEDMTIKAIAVKENFVNSAVAEAAYVIETPTQLGTPDVSCTEHGEDFLTFEWKTVTNGTDGTTKYAVSLDGGNNWETAQTTRTYTWSGLDANTSYTIYVKALRSANGQYLESTELGSCTQSTDAASAGWKETALSNIGSGDVFVIVGHSGYALTHNGGTNSAPSTVSVTVSGSKITGNVENSIKWNVSGNANDGYVFYPNASTATWLYCTSTNNGVRVGTNDNKAFILEDGYLKNVATSRYLSVYANNEWRCYGNKDNNPQLVKFYKYTGGTATPTFSVAEGTYAAAQSVTISCATEGASIYYTTDGTTPTSGSTAYTSAIDVNASMTIKAIAIKGDNASEEASATYTLKVATPTFSPAGGSYSTAQSVTISCEPTEGATIHYTTDGTDPTSSSSSYTGAINVNASMTIKAIAVKDNWTSSNVATAIYTIGGGTQHGEVTIDAAALDDGVLVSQGFTLTFAKNSGSTEPTYNSTGADLRLYAKGSVAIDGGSKTITNIVFTLSSQGKKRLAPITASTGTIATQASGDETVSWSGSASSVTFTVGDKADYGSDGSSKAGQLCFSSVTITY